MSIVASLCESLESRRLLASTGLAGRVETIDDAGRRVVADLVRLPERKSNVELTRYNADGSVDQAFGIDGVATILNMPSGGGTFKLVVDHAGRPLVLLDTTLFRMKANGARDKTLDGDGRLSVPVVFKTAGFDVDARNRPVIAGTSAGKTGDRATLFRLGERGVLDKSFGTGGAFKRAVPIDKRLQIPGDSTGLAVKVLDDGHVLGVAQFEFRKFQSRENDYFAIGIDAFRLDATGAPDASYGKKGATGYTNTFNAGSSIRSESFATFTAAGGLYTVSEYSPAKEFTNVTYRFIDEDGVLNPTPLDALPA